MKTTLMVHLSLAPYKESVTIVPSGSLEPGIHCMRMRVIAAVARIFMTSLTSAMLQLIVAIWTRLSSVLQLRDRRARAI